MRDDRLMGRRTVAALAAAVVLALLGASPVSGAPAGDVHDGIQVFNRDVYFIDGATLRNPRADTPPDAQLFNDAGVALPATWGAWGTATALSRAKVAGGGASATTSATIRLSGLIPNGVYSVFYGTLEPDSEHPGCPGVERTLPFTSTAGSRQVPDPSSFVADAAGAALYKGKVEGNLLAAGQFWFSIVYHLNGETYHPYPNAGEHFTAGGDEPCRSTYGHDAMRHILILQKW
jgi:hypothetical protein